MFDSYCIPNIPPDSNLYREIIEQTNSPFTFSKPQILSYIEDVAGKFSLSVEELNARWISTGRPKKVYNGINLTFIRMAIVRHLDAVGSLRDRDLAAALGIARPSICTLRSKGSDLSEVFDPEFKKYMDRVDEVSVKVVRTSPIKYYAE
jgi:hypothetical protein